VTGLEHYPEAEQAAAEREAAVRSLAEQFADWAQRHFLPWAVIYYGRRSQLAGFTGTTARCQRSR
jgi:hypothetical protein